MTEENKQSKHNNILMFFFNASNLLKALSILSYSQSGNFIFFPVFCLISGIMLNRNFFEVGESM